MKKRSSSACGDQDSTKDVVKKPRPLQVPRNEYQGYSLLGKKSFRVPIEPATICPRVFFQKYIATRTPCILEGLPTPTCMYNITPNVLQEHAGNVQVQVEKRQTRQECFGQNRTPSRQIVMTVSDFLQQIQSPDNGDLLYLSTQQQHEEGDIKDDTMGGPLISTLTKKGLIPRTVNWAGNLQLQSCNLWMGSSVQGSSSGWHHDYHDNVYVLMQGRKEFRLLSPDFASQMYCHGTVECIHPNGLVSHAGNELRADGVPLALLEEENDEEEEEELVLAKGFDYKSETDEEDGFDAAIFQVDNDNVKDDYDEIVGGVENDEVEQEEGTEDDDARPDSFSRVDLSLPKEDFAKQFPSFPTCLECIIHLTAGQSLYLPASWFHCVTSFADDETGDKPNQTRPTHVAINYWYHPPDNLDSYDDPYNHDFWKKQSNV